jgi:hypothetical protein
METQPDTAELIIDSILTKLGQLDRMECDANEQRILISTIKADLAALKRLAVKEKYQQLLLDKDARNADYEETGVYII